MKDLKYLKLYEEIEFREEEWDDEEIEKTKDRYYIGMSFYFGSEGIEFENLPNWEKILSKLKKETDYQDGDWVEEFVSVAQPRCDIYKLVKDKNHGVSSDVMEMIDKNGNVVPNMDFGVFLNQQDGLDFIHKYYFDIELVFAYVGDEFDYDKLIAEGERISDEFRNQWMKLGEDRQSKVDFTFDKDFMGETDRYFFDINNEGIYREI